MRSDFVLTKYKYIKTINRYTMKNVINLLVKDRKRFRQLLREKLDARGRFYRGLDEFIKNISQRRTQYDLVAKYELIDNGYKITVGYEECEKTDIYEDYLKAIRRKQKFILVFLKPVGELIPNSNQMFDLKKLIEVICDDNDYFVRFYYQRSMLNVS